MEKNMLGIMLDSSRNAVLNVETIKEYALIVSKMGYNTLMLYTEDTYQINDEPYFGHMRGRYSSKEIKEVDEYCKSIGIELVPCVQTLAHYTNMFRWQEYSDIHDIDDILLIGEEKTYLFLDKVFKTCQMNFSSRKINIGMDEAHMVGLGKYLQKNGYLNRYEILCDHLKRVCDLAQKYGFKPMIWSDMFFRLASNGAYYTTTPIEFEKKVLNLLPENVELVYWDYYKASEKRVSTMLDMHLNFNRKIYFASGSWTWSGFVPHNGFSIDSTKVGITECKKRDIKDVFTTLWGDNGAECSKFTVLPAVFAQSEFIKGDGIDKEKFKKIVGISYDEFMLLDLPDFISKESPHNPDKYGLYNDYFLGLFDSLDEIQDGSTIKKITIAKEKLKNVNAGKWQYVFDTLIALCEVLELKFNLGIKTRKAYKLDDKIALQKLIQQNYEPLVGKIENFYKTFKTQWYKENKSFGFEVHEVRIGGLILRTKSCMERLTEYVEGKIDRIEELEENTLLPTNEKQEYFNFNYYDKIVTAGQL